MLLRISIYDADKECVVKEVAMAIETHIGKVTVSFIEGNKQEWQQLSLSKEIPLNES